MASVKDNKISTVCHRLIHTKKKNRRVTPSSICISGNNQQQKKKIPESMLAKKMGGRLLSLPFHSRFAGRKEEGGISGVL